MNTENKKYEDLINVLSTYFNEEDLKLMDKYYSKALKIYEGMKRHTGEDYIYHSINIAYSLSELKMDKVTIGCALIHEAITNEKMTYDEVLEEFGEETAKILLCISKISGLKRTFKNNNIERYRKIIVGLAENPKVIFIKLADRLDNLKTLNVHSMEHQEEIIEETEKVFIPIAHRLGIKKFKSELEDLCLRNAYPDEYEEILNRLKTSKEELESSLKTMKEEITEILNDHNIKFTIVSRVKSVRGIFNKLKSGRKWNDIYDMLGIRVLVDKDEECYLVIGLIHAKYKSIPYRFKDYVANPKSNMYQSLHTTVFGVNNFMYEIQVRTYSMDEIAESGIASHWSYKEQINGSVKTSLDKRLEEFKALININDIEGNLEFFQNLNKELTKGEIYVFTPKGDVIELPDGATPIDFAYRIHTEIGNSVTGALVNNKIVKLNQELQDGDIVSLITQKGRGPNKAWLKFVKTDSAKGRIKSYFFKKEKEKIIETGRELLENDIKKKNFSLNESLTNENINRVVEELKLDNADDIYFGIATLKFTTNIIINKLLNIKEEKKKEEILDKLKPIKQKCSKDIIIAGADDILTNIASCCSPVKGEEIVGYITKGNGVSIHRKGCYNISSSEERIVEAQWCETTDHKYTAYLNVFVSADNDKLINIITIATKYEINIESLNLKDTDKSLYYELICKVKNIDELNLFISDLKGLKFVSKVERTYLK